MECVNDVVVEYQLYVNIRDWLVKSSRSQSLEQTGADRLDPSGRCFVVVESLPMFRKIVECQVWSFKLRSCQTSTCARDASTMAFQNYAWSLVNSIARLRSGYFQISCIFRIASYKEIRVQCEKFCSPVGLRGKFVSMVKRAQYACITFKHLHIWIHLFIR